MLDKIKLIKNTTNTTNKQINEAIPENISKKEQDTKFIRVKHNSDIASRMLDKKRPYIKTRRESYDAKDHMNRTVYRSREYAKEVEVLNVSHTYDKYLIIEYRIINDKEFIIW